MIESVRLPQDWQKLADEELASRLCASFEQAWRSGLQPRLEEYLPLPTGAAGERLVVGLMELEKRLRRERGEAPLLEEYTRRFPQYEVALIRAWSLGMDSVDATIGSTVIDAIDSAASRVKQASPSQPALPQKIGRFLPDVLLGRGGFGEVWRAFDPLLARHVAIKRLRPDRAASAETTTRFLAEGRRLAQIDHPGIVRVHDVGFEDGVCYIVSQVVDGQTLADRMDVGPVNCFEAARIVADVAEAAHAAHLQDIIHRDIKPANILLAANGCPYLADFGLAVTEQEQLAEDPATMGTYAYMSPEQLQGQSHLTDARTDIYSLGVILYRLLTGRVPFLARTPAEYRDQVLQRNPRPPRTIDDTIPERLEQICLRCLNRDPAGRYTTAHDLAADLRKAMQPGAGSSPTALRVALAASALGMLLVGYWLWSGGEKERVPVGHQTKPVIADVPAVGDVETDHAQPDRAARGERDHKGMIQEADSVVAPMTAPLVWHPLLIRAPSEVLWTRGNGLNAYENDKALEQLTVRCTGTSLLRIGRADCASFAFQIDLLQLPWSGGIGVFYGLHETAEGSRETCIFSLRANHAPAPRLPFLLVHERLTLRADAGGGVLVDSQAISAPVAVEYPGDRPVQLELTFQADRLTAVRWSGRKLDFSPQASQLAPPSIRGDIGVLTLAAHAVYQNARLMLHD